MKQNTSYDDLYAARLLSQLNDEPMDSPWIGALILGLYSLALGLFVWWAVWP